MNSSLQIQSRRIFGKASGLRPRRPVLKYGRKRKLNVSVCKGVSRPPDFATENPQFSMTRRGWRVRGGFDGEDGVTIMAFPLSLALSHGEEITKTRLFGEQICLNHWQSRLLDLPPPPPPEMVNIREFEQVTSIFHHTSRLSASHF